MKEVVGLPWVRLSAGVLCVLLAQSLFAPTVAQASCGHYVVWGAKANEIPLPITASAPREEPQPAVPVQPCTGPGCSRHVPTPMTAPVPVVSVVRESWGASVLPVHVPPVDASSAVADDPAARPIRRASAIFHPPR